MEKISNFKEDNDINSKENFNFNSIFQIFFKFKKKILKKDDTNPQEIEGIKGNIYLILPNINLEITRISTLKLSNSSKINKFLVKKIEKLQIDSTNLTWGLLGMSLEHRFVALLANQESRGQIIFGIWLNFPNEKNVKKNISEEMLNKLLTKNKEEIYKKTLNFLLASEKINEINSASPDESTFILIVFFAGIPFNFEVKIHPNEMEKAKETEFSNEWIIAKADFFLEKKYFFEHNINFNTENEKDFCFDFSKNISNVNFRPMSKYFIEKMKFVESKNFKNFENSKNVIKNNRSNISNSMDVKKFVKQNFNKENFQKIVDYRDSLNDLFEREKFKEKNLSENENNFWDKNGNEISGNDNENFCTKRKISKEEKNFDYDYPLSMEKNIGRSHLVNLNKNELKNSHQKNNNVNNNHNNINNSNNEMRNSQISNHYKNIPRQQSVNFIMKNPDKELTYWESFSKENEHKRVNSNSYCNNKPNENYFTHTPEIFEESETLTYNNSEASKNVQNSLKTNSVSLSKKHERKFVPNEDTFFNITNSNNNINSNNSNFFDSQNRNNYSNNNFNNNSNSKHSKKFSGSISNNIDKNISQNNNNFKISQNNPNIPINNINKSKLNFGISNIQSNQNNFISNQNFQSHYEEYDSNQINNNINQFTQNKNIKNLNFPVDENQNLKYSESKNHLANAYTIIYDQANSIQILEEKVMNLLTELETVNYKLNKQIELNNNINNDRSKKCNCTGKKMLNEEYLISIGVNTTQIQLDSSIDSNTNSIQSNKKEAKKPKTEEDYRYDNFLNENSINFPKQFLDMDSKQYDSHRDDKEQKEVYKDESIKYFNNNNNENFLTNKENKNFINNNNENNTLISGNFNINNSNNSNSNFNNNTNTINFPSNNNINISNQKRENSSNQSQNHKNNINGSSSLTVNESNVNSDNNLIMMSFNGPNFNNYNAKNQNQNAYSNQNNIYEVNNNYQESTNSYKSNNNKYNYPFNSNPTYQNLNQNKKKFSTIHNISPAGNVTKNEEKSENFEKKIPQISNYNGKHLETIDLEKKHKNNFHYENSDNSDEDILRNNYENNKILNQKNVNQKEFATSFINNLNKFDNSSFINFQDQEENNEKDNFNFNEKNNKENFRTEIKRTVSLLPNMENENTNNENDTFNNNDISNSIDPGSNRYFLKAPSLLYKTNNSLMNSKDENEFLKFNKNKINLNDALGSNSNNDVTIQIPKIICGNESIESNDDNDF